VKRASETRVSARGLRIAVVKSAFNDRIVAGLHAGALAELREAGAADKNILSFEAPGAFELPLAAKAAAETGRFDAVIALGAVIRGDTDHYEHIAREAASGLAAASRETGVPIAFGVLTTRDEAQAVARSVPGADNKGREAARAAIAMARLLETLRRPRASKRR
jgi:6,7-dimethyl-8-ribityllumazine synthase